MKKFFTGVLFGAVLVAGIVFIRAVVLNNRFDDLHSRFITTSLRLNDLLEPVEANYDGATPEQVEQHCSRCSHDGTFDTADELIAQQKLLIGRMGRTCTRRRVKDYTTSLCVNFNFETRLYAVECPFAPKDSFTDPAPLFLPDCPEKVW